RPASGGELVALLQVGPLWQQRRPPVDEAGGDPAQGEEQQQSLELGLAAGYVDAAQGARRHQADGEGQGDGPGGGRRRRIGLQLRLGRRPPRQRRFGAHRVFTSGSAASASSGSLGPTGGGSSPVR